MSEDERIKAAWNRLQTLACLRAAKVGFIGHRKQPHHPDETARADVEILKRGNEVELKMRVFWYLTFHPAIFEECSRNKWDWKALGIGV